LAVNFFLTHGLLKEQWVFWGLVCSQTHIVQYK